MHCSPQQERPTATSLNTRICTSQPELEIITMLLIKLDLDMASISLITHTLHVFINLEDIIYLRKRP